MIILLEQGDERAVFDNVTHITTLNKPSVIGGTREVIHLYNNDKLLMGGDDIDLSNTKLTILPNAETE